MSHLTSAPPSRPGRSRTAALVLAVVSVIVVTVLLVADRPGSDADGAAAAGTTAPAADAPNASVEPPAVDTPADAVEAPTTVAAGSITPVSMGEFTFEMPTTFEAGRHTFEVTNDGEVPHEFALGQVGSHGSHLGQTEWLDAGAVEVLEVDLAPGSYEIGCHVPGHYDAGMTTTISVVG